MLRNGLLRYILHTSLQTAFMGSFKKRGHVLMEANIFSPDENEVIYLSPNVCIDAYVRIKHVCAGTHLFLYIYIYFFIFYSFIFSVFFFLYLLISIFILFIHFICLYLLCIYFFFIYSFIYLFTIHGLFKLLELDNDQVKETA